MEVSKQENKKAEVAQLDIGFDQIWSLVQQLSVNKRIEFLDKLQAALESDKHIKPKTNEDIESFDKEKKEVEKIDKDENISTFKNGLKAAFEEVEQI